MAQISRETFGFTQEFQDLILACVLKRPEFNKYSPMLNSKFFTGSVSTLTARAIFDYHKRRKAFPTKEVLMQLMAEEAKKLGDDSDNDVREYVLKLFKIRTLKVWEEVHTKVVDFCRERAVLKAFKLGIDHFKEGTIPEGGYVKLFEKAVATGSEFTDLEMFKFDPDRLIEKPEPVLLLAGHTMATAGNLMALSGLPKVGKSGAVSAILSALMAGTDAAGDRLGFLAHNSDGKAVLHFDTEQSQFDHQSLVEVALDRADVHESDTVPAHLHSYAVASFTVEGRLSALRNKLRELHEAGGLHAVLLDGVGDFCHDPNDSKESFALVDELHRLAAKYGTVIIVVLHENPPSKGSDTSKTRGHLGSQLERKSETNLRLRKNAEGVTVMFSEKSRHAHVPEASGPCFHWDDEAQMHVACASTRERKADAKTEAMRELVASVFVPTEDGPARLRNKELIELIMTKGHCGETTAKTRLRLLVTEGLVVLDSGFYRAEEAERVKGQ